MPVEDAITLIIRDFGNYKSGGRSVPVSSVIAKDRHPDAIQVLLNMLADNNQLTVLQYERVLKYLEIKREEQVQVELGESMGAPLSNPKQAELQSRILNILNSSKSSSSTSATMTATIAPVPSPVPPPAGNRQRAFILRIELGLAHGDTVYSCGFCITISCAKAIINQESVIITSQTDFLFTEATHRSRFFRTPVNSRARKVILMRSRQYLLFT